MAGAVRKLTPKWKWKESLGCRLRRRGRLDLEVRENLRITK